MDVVWNPERPIEGKPNGLEGLRAENNVHSAIKTDNFISMTEYMIKLFINE